MSKSSNLINQRFGRLTVIEKTPERKHKNVVWKCLCDCGKEHYAYTNLLTSGGCQSCGCLQKEKVSKNFTKSHSDLIGQKFGKLTIINKSKTLKSSNGSYLFECLCDCGKTVYQPLSALTSYHTISCGCSNKSAGELKIFKLLNENNIPFECEKSFDDCRNPLTNYPLRFDFYINNSYLIEFDGKQHFKDEGNWGESLEEIQKKDNYKDQWCKEHNIPLIRIPYTKLKTLTVEDLLLPSEK